MIPFLKHLVWSLLWDEASAGRLVRGLLLAALLGVQPLLQDAISGKALTSRQVGFSIALAIGGALAGWLRGGERNAPPSAP